MQRHDVGTLDDFIDRQQIDLVSVSHGCVEKRVVGDQIHPERTAPERHSLSDTAKADDAERTPVQLQPEKTLAVPNTCFERCVSRRDVAGQRQHHGKSVLGSRDQVGRRCVDDQNPQLRSCLHIHIVDTNPGAADDSEPFPRPQHVRSDGCATANDQRIEIGQQLLQTWLVFGSQDMQVDASLPENLESGVMQRISDQNSVHSQLSFACPSRLSSIMHSSMFTIKASKSVICTSPI